MSKSTISISTSSEPLELRVATTRQRSQEPAERQLDQLLDLLAIDQAADQGTTDPFIATPAAITTREVAIAEAIGASTAINEITIVITCHNNADTIGNAVLKANYALEKLGVGGEVIVADAGSRDDSVEIAEALGAKVISHARPHIGAALREAIDVAKGCYIITADGDDRYDFSALPKMYDRLCEGADFVQGCRIPQAGGRIMPGAMSLVQTFSHRAQSKLARVLFRVPVNDIHCNLRAFRKDFALRMDPRACGREFCTELLIKSAKYGARISEIPITYYQPEHHRLALTSQSTSQLARTLRYFAFRKLRATCLLPAAIIGCLGVIGATLSATQSAMGLGIGTFLLSACAIIVAVQLVCCALIARVFGEVAGLRSGEETLRKISKVLTFERCVTGSLSLISIGTSLISYQAISWMSAGFPNLNPVALMQVLIPAATSIVCGTQFLITSFVISLLRMPRRS